MVRRVLYLLLMIFTATAAMAAESPLVGKTVPTFRLPDETNREVDFGVLIDRATIIYFTENSCHYCTQIIALLKRAKKKFGDKIRVIGINVMAKDNRLVKAYKEELGFTFPMFAGNRYDVLRTYRINYVPVLVFVDSKGIIRKVVGHYMLEPELHQAIREILQR